MSNKGQKVRDALRARILEYERRWDPSSGHERRGDPSSDNIAKGMKKPGSLNRKKGYGARTRRKK